LKNGVVILAAALAADKVNLVVKVSTDAVKKGVHAGKIIKVAAQVTGGNGGGRPNMAQAGGKMPGKIPEAFEKAIEILESQIDN
jgi:alanyl-tRNA synthetase